MPQLYHMFLVILRINKQTSVIVVKYKYINPKFSLYLETYMLDVTQMPRFIFYRTKLRTLYMYTGGFYTYSIFALIFWETRRSDFGVSMSHHVATLVLILFSYVAKYVQFAHYNKMNSVMCFSAIWKES